MQAQYAFILTQTGRQTVCVVHKFSPVELNFYVKSMLDMGFGLEIERL